MQTEQGDSPRMVYLLQVISLTSVYIISGRLGLDLAFVQSNASLIWPPAAFSLAALILFGPRLWPGVFLGALVLSFHNDSEPVLGMTIAIGNTLGAVVGSILMVRFFDFRPALNRVRDVVVLCVIGALGAASISAGVGTTAVWLSGGIDPGKFSTVLLIWWRGDFGAVITLTPFLLLLQTGTPSWSRLLRHREFWGISIILLVSCFVAFGGALTPNWEQAAAHFPIVCLVWAGVRLGLRGAVLISIVAIACSSIGTAHGFGPFAVADPHISMTLLWSYGVELGTIALTLAAAVSQRDRAELKHEQQLTERERIEREQLLLVERERIMREMHDGLGGQLVSILSMVQRGKAENGEIAEALRRTLDDMRIMIDSLESSETDFQAMLGKLRARLEPMLRRNGLDLKWRIDELAALEAFEPETSLHCLRIIQESVANVIQHARATQISIEVTADESEADSIRIEIRDDGVGMNTDSSNQGRGTKNMRARADALGAELRIDRMDPGRRIRLIVPVAGIEPGAS
jgi:signal transduction histidine kinase